MIYSYQSPRKYCSKLLDFVTPMDLPDLTSEILIYACNKPINIAKISTIIIDYFINPSIFGILDPHNKSHKI